METETKKFWRIENCTKQKKMYSKISSRLFKCVWSFTTSIIVEGLKNALTYSVNFSTAQKSLALEAKVKHSNPRFSVDPYTNASPTPPLVNFSVSFIVSIKFTFIVIFLSFIPSLFPSFFFMFSFFLCILSSFLCFFVSFFSFFLSFFLSFCHSFLFVYVDA
jgi:hypothetical protein